MQLSVSWQSCRLLFCSSPPTFANLLSVPLFQRESSSDSSVQVPKSDEATLLLALRVFYLNADSHVRMLTPEAIRFRLEAPERGSTPLVSKSKRKLDSC